MAQNQLLPQQQVLLGIKKELSWKGVCSHEEALETLSRLEIKSIYGLKNVFTPTLLEYEEESEQTIPFIGIDGKCLVDGSGMPVEVKMGYSTYILIDMIYSTIIAYNCRSTMSDYQAYMTAKDFIDVFPNDPLGVFKLFFKAVRTGEFGTSYGRIDEPTLFNWYRQFRKKALDLAGELRKESSTALPQAEEQRADADYIDSVCQRLTSKYGCFSSSTQPKEVAAKSERNEEFKRLYYAAKTDEEKKEIIKKYM